MDEYHILCLECHNNMRRIHNKYNKKQLSESLKRAQSHSHFVLTQNKTLAQLNHPSNRHSSPQYHPFRPLRVSLPGYFNVPKFQDQDLFKHSQEGALFEQVRAQGQLRRKVKDLGILAQGMRRAKNIKEQSRYYFTQAVLQNNLRAFTQSIASLQKFLKIVLFIRDEKSVELVLNAIGAEYMAMGDPKSSLSFMQLRQNITENRVAQTRELTPFSVMPTAASVSKCCQIMSQPFRNTLRQKNQQKWTKTTLVQNFWRGLQRGQAVSRHRRSQHQTKNNNHLQLSLKGAVKLEQSLLFAVLSGIWTASFVKWGLPSWKRSDRALTNKIIMRDGKRRDRQCACQLCSKERQIREIRGRRRELSLASIYRKDFKGVEEVVEQDIMPQCSARKNQSSNFRERSHSYLQINSTYLANFKPTPRFTPLPSPHKQKVRQPDILESYLSTYSDAHRKLPVLAQESYKIADPYACSPARPFAKITEYSKNYQLNNSPKEQQTPRKDHNFEDGVRVFQTTQKAAYIGVNFPQERARGPTDNMTPLPTSPFLYKSTYRQEFFSRPSASNPESHSQCHINLYRF